MIRYWQHGFERSLQRFVRHPLRTLALAIVLTLLLFFPLGWSTWQAYITLQRIATVDFKLQEQVGIIVHLDEVLTLSAKMNAATGDTRWERRYLAFEPQLDAAIKTVIALAPDAYEGEGAAQTDAANMRLVSLEKNAFDLVRQGKREQAGQLLASQTYERNKQIYSAGIQRSVIAIRQRVQTSLTTFGKQLGVASALALLSLLILLPVWAVVLQVLRRCLQEREIARRVMAAANVHLEEKVRVRTDELATANQEIMLLNQRLQQENSRLGSELEIAHKLQQMILPNPSELREINNLEVACSMISMNEVGGDYYDVIQLGDRVLISIGDVTGHGLESGVMAIMAQTAIQTLITAKIDDVVEFHNCLNQVLYHNMKRMQSNKNMTLTVLDYQLGALSLSGQHESMIVIRENGELEEIDTIDLGFPLALEKDISTFVATARLSLQPGDVAVLYTDGIPEAENIDKQFYGLERFRSILLAHHRQPAETIRQAVIEDLRGYIGQQRIFDDITLVVIKQL